MAKPGNDPQDPQSSVREKFKRFYSELSDAERAYVEARMKQLGSIEVPSPALVINQSDKTLVITNVDYSGGATPVFAGSSPSASPQVGDIITAGNNYGGQFTWIEYFFGSNVAIDLQAQDGSGTIRTEVGMNMLGGWGYECINATGSLACADPGTNPDSWDANVTVINS